MWRRDSVTATRCVSRVAAAPVRLRNPPTRPLRTSSSCAGVGRSSTEGKLSWPSFSSRVMRARSESIRRSRAGCWAADEPTLTVIETTSSAASILRSAPREVTTQSSGFYALLGLVPGEYDVTARQIGMTPQKVRVRALIGEVFPLDFKLATSAIEVSAVTVVAAAGVEVR